MTTRTVTVNQLREGGLVVIDGEPCKIISISISKTGKHGAAKARIEGIGLLDGRRHSLIASTDDKVEVPVIERRQAQVIAVLKDTIQLMDPQTYEVYEVQKPSPDELGGKELQPGMQVMVMQIMNVKKIEKILE